MTDTTDDTLASRLLDDLTAARAEAERAGALRVAKDEKFRLDDYLEAFVHRYLVGGVDC